MISKIPQQNIEHIFFFIMLDTAFYMEGYMEKLNENRFVIFIYYECRYAQFALSSVIELPRIPAYYPKIIHNTMKGNEPFLTHCLLPYIRCN